MPAPARAPTPNPTAAVQRPASAPKRPLNRAPAPSTAAAGSAAARLSPAPASSARLKAPAAGINPPGAGQPLPEPVQLALEESLGVSMAEVRIHTDADSAARAKNMSARAFTVGTHIYLGPGELPTDLSLVGHEAAHVVQQQGAAAVQRLSSQPGDPFEREAHQAAAAVTSQQPFSVVTRTPDIRVQRLGVDSALNYFADKANLLPGFRMFTLILGVNPVNMSRVERSAANILRALIEVIPGGSLISQALENYGVFAKVGNWAEQQIKTLGMAGSTFKQAIDKFLDSLSWSDILDLGGVWERAKRIITEPIDRILNFAKSMVTGILTFIKDAILMPLAKLAEGTRGWDLLIAILGKNPITGAAVPRTAETLIGGFMKLIGQEEIWDNMKKANAIPRAWAWFQGAMGTLMGFVTQIPTLAMNAFKSLELTDLILVPRAFAKVAAVFGNFIGEFITWAGKAVWNLLEIIFEVVAPAVMPYLKKAAAAFKIILKNPIGFVGNLVRAGKQGFEMFSNKFFDHLKAALINWIIGPLSSAGVYIPKSFSLMEIIKLVISVLGLTWQNIREKLVKIIPDPVLAGLEKTADVLVTLVKDGPAAAWEQIKAELSELKDKMVAQVTQMITSEVVNAAVMKLVSMLNPAGAFVQAIIAIYNTITFFIEKINQIAAVVASVIDSISAIASGQVDNAAKKVEQTLINTLTIAIAFLAKFAGLGNIPEKIVGLIKKIREPIDRGLEKIVAWLGVLLNKLAGAAKAGVAKVTEWWKAKIPFKTKSGESHELSYSGDEKNPVPMVASNIKKPVSIKMDEFYNKASRKNASVKEKDKLALIAKVKSDANKPLKDPNLKVLPEPKPNPKDLAEVVGTFEGSSSDKEGKPILKTGTLGPNTVGLEMTIDRIGYDPKKGSDAKKSAQVDLMKLLVTRKENDDPKKYIKGHLLSAKLGGEGDATNLFPITANANKQHLLTTETKIKEWVAVKDHSASYEVKVQGISSRLEKAGPKRLNYVNSTFVCHAILKDEAGKEKELSTSIPSIFLVKQEAEVKNKQEAEETDETE